MAVASTQYAEGIRLSRHEAQTFRPERLGVRGGDSIRLTSSTGSYAGRAKIDQIKPGNIEVHWPEGSCLLSLEELDVASREPDYNAIVSVEKAEERNAAGMKAC